MTPTSTRPAAPPASSFPSEGGDHDLVSSPSLAASAPSAAPSEAAPEADRWWERWRLVVAAAACWALLGLTFGLDNLTALPPRLIVGGYLLSYLAGGSFAAREAIGDLLRRQVNVDLLMVTAAVGAALIGAWGEGGVLLALFSTSNALEHHALERTRRAVSALLELSPDTATLVHEHGEETVPVSRLRPGDRVLIRPGERVPVDGEVVEGRSNVDQAAITGESIPVAKAAGDSVFAGTLNALGALQVRVTKASHESALARIIAFVAEARERKSRAQGFTDRFEGRYAVGVIAFAALVAVAPPLLTGAAWDDAFYRAMTLLVVASPCALVISTPASTLSALANAARNGILFKGGVHLENAGAIRIVAFDKTGTLTGGRPVVTDVVPLAPGMDAATLLALAAGAERLSEHPLAAAIERAARDRGLILAAADEFSAVPGRGVVARVGAQRLRIGNEALFTASRNPSDQRDHTGQRDQVAASDASVSGLDLASEQADRFRDAGKTAVIIGDDEGVLGLIAVADVVRPEAAAAIAALARLGIVRTVMLTGDDPRVARAIAAQVGVTEIYADLLPEQKLEVIRRLQHEAPTAMVGDGVNDAPALATATLGVAMGGAGTDVALETADVVLMADDLRKLPYALALGRRTRRTILQNLTLSLGVIVVLVASALSVGIPLPLGVVGHEGSTVIVVLNGLRLLRTRA